MKSALNFVSTVVRICGLSLAVLSMACSTQTPPAEPAVTPAPVAVLKHTVKYQGETLGVISSWYTGTSRNWQTIKDANPGLNERKIRQGEVISIPENLLKQRKPLPESFVVKNNITPVKDLAQETVQTGSGTVATVEAAAKETQSASDEFARKPIEVEQQADKVVLESAEKTVVNEVAKTTVEVPVAQVKPATASTDTSPVQLVEQSKVAPVEAPQVTQLKEQLAEESARLEENKAKAQAATAAASANLAAQNAASAAQNAAAAGQAGDQQAVLGAAKNAQAEAEKAAALAIQQAQQATAAAAAQADEALKNMPEQQKVPTY